MFYPLEPLLQYLRIKKIIPHLISGGIMLDLGCDTPPILIHKVHQRMKKCIGLDISLKPKKYQNIQLFKADLLKTIPLPDKSINSITLLAVLEHIKNPQHLLKECYRLLKKDGALLITVPTPQSKPVLEFLSTLYLIRPEMIDQHENYFKHKDLEKLLSKAGFTNIELKDFELGFNTFVKATKT